MWFALLRGSFWLAALAAGLALFVPGLHASALGGTTAVAGLLAVASWRFGSPQARARPTEAPLADDLPIGWPALGMAAARVEDACGRAASFDAALHAAAAILKGELGAREAHALRIASIDAGEVQLARLVASAEGLRTQPPMPADASGACAAAVRAGHRVLTLPDAIVLPILAGDDGGGLVELIDLQLAIDATALADLLDRSALALTEAAGRDRPNDDEGASAGLTLPPNRRILLLQDGNDEALTKALQRLGMRVDRRLPEAAAFGTAETQCDLVLVDVDAGGGASCPNSASPSGMRVPRIAVSLRNRPEDEALYVQRGFDALLCNPYAGRRLAAMLSRFFGAMTCQVADEQAGGGAPSQAQPRGMRLDAAALARLTELDPKGESRLIERVLKAYQNSVSRLMPQFEQARSSGNLDLMRQVAHTLKSSSAAIGAVKFSQLCAEIETMIRSDRTEGLTTRAEAMRGESEFVLQAVKQLLDSGP